MFQMENPAAVGASRVPECDLAGSEISPESKSLILDLQVNRLRRLCAVDVATAVALAPLCFGRAAQ